MINYLSEYSTAIKTEKIFALVIESGFAYCCVWVRSFFKKKNEVPYPCVDLRAHADTLPNFGVPCVSKTGLRCHGRRSSIRLGGSTFSTQSVHVSLPC